MACSRAPILLLLAFTTTACARQALRPFPARPPMWEDPDRQPFAPKPEEYYSGFYWDGVDQMVFRPVSRFFLFEAEGEATNVNAMDEVPNSSWFHNRIGRESMSLEAFLGGFCEGYPPMDADGPWTVTGSKPDGIHQGFFMKDPDGRRYVMKFDDPAQQVRGTAADLLGAILYHAVGYHVPCNRIVYFDPDVLQIAEGATTPGPRGEIPLEQHHLETLFAWGTRLPDGRMRAMASAFIPGEPLGPFRYEGMRKDDPNDVVRHQDRRELRGLYVLASWSNNFDSREANTFDTWIATGRDKGYVRHYHLDFGEALGALWNRDAVSRRHGRTHYLDLKHLSQDFVSLGAIDHSWYTVRYGPAGDELGYFDVETFEPAEWRAGYPNPAFLRMMERDAAWMARILARIPDSYLVAAVDAADVPGRVRSELLRILRGRRQKIFERWLRRVSPLTDPVLLHARASTWLCLTDLALTTGIAAGVQRLYRVEVRGLSEGCRACDLRWSGRVYAHGRDRICLELPDFEARGMDYGVVDVTGLYGPDDTLSGPARVHLGRTPSWRVVGLERP